MLAKKKKGVERETETKSLSAEIVLLKIHPG